MPPSHPRWIAVSLGDPSGIGPEILLKALAAKTSRRPALVVFGDVRTIGKTAEMLGLPQPLVRLSRFSGSEEPGQYCVDVPCGKTAPPGFPTRQTGINQVQALDRALESVRDGRCSALLTGPVHKETFFKGRRRFLGHTDYFSRYCGYKDLVPFFWGRRFHVAIATEHLSLADVPAALTRLRMQKVLSTLADFFRNTLKVDGAHIGVMGLNPHAGETGMLGHEEERVIEPAMKVARTVCPGTIFHGPLVPDAAFLQYRSLKLNALVAAYHDQGLIPLKLAERNATVQVTLGLPFLRVSPDHGTAHDIAGRGIAHPGSFIAALNLAQRWLR